MLRKREKIQPGTVDFTKKGTTRIRRPKKLRPGMSGTEYHVFRSVQTDSSAFFVHFTSSGQSSDRMMIAVERSFGSAWAQFW